MLCLGLAVAQKHIFGESWGSPHPCRDFLCGFNHSWSSSQGHLLSTFLPAPLTLLVYNQDTKNIKQSRHEWGDAQRMAVMVPVAAVSACKTEFTQGGGNPTYSNNCLTKACAFFADHRKWPPSLVPVRKLLHHVPLNTSAQQLASTGITPPPAATICC